MPSHGRIPIASTGARITSRGAPYWGADVNDIALFYGHGTWVDGPGTQGQSQLQMGSSSGGGCSLSYGIGSYYMPVGAHWGDSDDLNVVVLDACSSLQCEILSAYFPLGGGNLSMMLGFHGLSHDSLGHAQEMLDWIDDSRYDGLGSNWVDYMTNLNPYGDDVCGVAFVYGATASDRDKVYMNSGFNDFKNVTGDHASAWYYGYSGCNPGDGAPL